MTQCLAPAPVGSDLTPVPGDSGLPLVGHALDYSRDPLKMWAALRALRAGLVVGALGRRLVTLQGPEAARRCSPTATRPSPPVRPGASDRPVLRRRPDAAGLRRAPCTIAASCSRRSPASAWPRYLDPMNQASRRGLARWRPAPASISTGRQAAHPRRRRRRLHGRRTRAPQETRIGSTGASSTASGPAVAWCASPCRGALGPRLRAAACSRTSCGSTCPPQGREATDLFSALCRESEASGERFTDDGRHQPHDLPADGRARHVHHRPISTMALLPGQHPEWQERCRANPSRSARTHRLWPPANSSPLSTW